MFKEFSAVLGDTQKVWIPNHPAVCSALTSLAITPKLTEPISEPGGAPNAPLMEVDDDVEFVGAKLFAPLVGRRRSLSHLVSVPILVAIAAMPLFSWVHYNPLSLAVPGRSMEVSMHMPHRAIVKMPGTRIRAVGKEPVVQNEELRHHHIC